MTRVSVYSFPKVAFVLTLFKSKLFDVSHTKNEKKSPSFLSQKKKHTYGADKKLKQTNSGPRNLMLEWHVITQLISDFAISSKKSNALSSVILCCRVRDSNYLFDTNGSGVFFSLAFCVMTLFFSIRVSAKHFKSSDSE